MRFGSGVNQRVVIAAFALICMSAGGLLGYQWLKGQESQLAEKRKALEQLYQNPVEVVIATHDLADDATITAGDLAIKTVPERYVQPYYIPANQRDKAIGMITLAKIAKDEQILKNKLRRESEARVRPGSTLSSLMPKGKRAVTMAIDAITGVGGFVNAGDIIDILWTLGRGEQAVTVVLFQDVQVLAVGSELPGRTKEGKDTTPRENRNITLALTPQEASFLLFAREQGGLQLSLRPHAETGHVDVKPATLATLMQMQLNMGGQEAPPPPKLSRQVEIYRGLDKKETVALPDSE